VLAKYFYWLPVTNFRFSVNNRRLFNDLDWVAGKKYLLLDKKPGVSGPGPEKWLVGKWVSVIDVALRVGHDG